MSKNHIKYILVFITISCFYSAISSANEHIWIGWVFAMANAPIIIAQEKKYFHDLSVDVEALPFRSGPLVHQAKPWV